MLLSKGLKVACRENEVDGNAWLMPEHLRPFMSTVCPAVLAPLPEPGAPHAGLSLSSVPLKLLMLQVEGAGEL